MIFTWLASGPPAPAMESAANKDKKEKKEKTLHVQKIKKDLEKQTTPFNIKTITKPSKKYKGEPGDFIFKDADLENVILFFAKQYKLNIIIDPGISGKVTCRMIRVPWDQALDVILKQHGLVMVSEGSITRAAPIKNKKNH